ncbi:MAG: 4-(cytidine 5'-diphospho)-2-C-methyl-D-erythritol kinase [candidate division Zixibacteria bacterium]|nr:4-(cytidine 5'-diphospho)-2-C-methyl-D-erythritol kinase [candidate division Zixibacteria bacterium]MDD5426366.1 4-(cytidine 5'-diphospho)-2-C-methyl-D-erythritol kinase [candidate division Zixibacteria bacterium]
MFFKCLNKDSLYIGAPAKVNLFLEILNRREDGYHNIYSLFQAVSLFDRLKFTRTDNPDITLSIENNPELPGNENNLVVKACNLIKKEYGIDNGLEIHLQKNIPTGAGLGGGSSDAAAAIFACNYLFELNLNYPEMAQLGFKLGSDVPFFFSKGQALITGRGENIEEVTLPTDYWLVLITPNLTISTAESYGALKIGLTKPQLPFKLSCYETVEEFVEYLKLSSNNFEEAHLLSYPVLGKIKEELLKSKALLVRMSGSGSTMFGIYREAAEWINNKFTDQGDWQINIVRPITLPLIKTN